MTDVSAPPARSLVVYKNRPARVTATVIEKPAQIVAGAWVETGQLLVRLDESDFLRQDEIAARIRAASPRLAELQDPHPLDLDGVQALLDPGSEWRLHRDWFKTSAMADLLGGRDD